MPPVLYALSVVEQEKHSHVQENELLRFSIGNLCITKCCEISELRADRFENWTLSTLLVATGAVLGSSSWSVLSVN